MSEQRGRQRPSRSRVCKCSSLEVPRSSAGPVHRVTAPGSQVCATGRDAVHVSWVKIPLSRADRCWQANNCRCAKPKQIPRGVRTMARQLPTHRHGGRGGCHCGGGFAFVRAGPVFRRDQAVLELRPPPATVCHGLSRVRPVVAQRQTSRRESGALMKRGPHARLRPHGAGAFRFSSRRW